MKKISMILVAALFAVTAVSADKKAERAAAKKAKQECLKSVNSAFKTKAAEECKDKKGKEKRECVTGIKKSHAEAKKSCNNPPSTAPTSEASTPSSPSTETPSTPAPESK